jgi:hypothetical protein
MSQFEKLMAELGQLSADQETMAKALPADDGKDEKKIQAAAGEGGSDGDADDAGGPADGDADDEKDMPMAKSFKFTLEDGTEVEAQDGSEMVKALSDRLYAVETDKTNLAKALESAVGVIKGYAPMIKSLQEQVSKLGGEGRGRKAVVSVVEKPAPGAQPLAKSEPAGMSHDQFFAKALAAQKEGRLSGVDIAMAESCLNRGEAIPQSIVARVVQ